jgi:prephenate dehydrogenase
MTVKIGIIGLGQIGASIGLALASRKDQVTTIGYDKSTDVTRKAHKLEVVESFAHNLYACVKEADLVILALPIDQVYETLESIAQKIHEEAVVIDTAPAKQVVADWAKELLPSKRHYVGLTPALNPRLLNESAHGIEAARADLFEKGLVAVTALHTTSAEAIKLATSFVSLLGARAYFADLAEVDGIMAAVSNLPALAAAALTETVIDQPGWSDIRKLAGRPFADGMRPLEGVDATALAEASRQNRVNTVRVLNEYIATLNSLRDEIEGDGKKSLENRLERIQNGRAQWLRVHADGDWQAIESIEQEIPTFSDLWMQQLGLGKLIGLGQKKKDDDRS